MLSSKPKSISKLSCRYKRNTAHTSPVCKVNELTLSKLSSAIDLNIFNVM